MFPVTAPYAALLALLLVLLSLRVIRLRRGTGIGLGDGGDLRLQRAVRGHGNFAEYAPLGLLLLMVAEAAGLAAWMLHVLGLMLLAGRAMHAWALAFTLRNAVLRTGGMVLTFSALLLLAAALLWVTLSRM